MNKVSIIIPTVKTEAEIAGLITEIKNTVYYDLDLIVISGVRSAMVNFNMGLDRAKGEFVIMCDDDIEGYPKYWDKTLLDVLEKLEPEGATIVGARLLNPDGTLNRVNYRNYDLSVEYSQTRTMITACSAWRNTKLRFDENYIGWGWGDTDWRRQLGGKSFVVNTVRVTHRNEEKNPLGSKEQIAKNHEYYKRKWSVEKMKIVVFTCDEYSWLIPTFLHFYKKNWPDNPYQTVLVTETIKTDGVDTFCAGKIPWADRAIKYLESFDDKTFLLLLDDYILNKTVDTDMIKRAESLCVGDIGCVRLYAHDRDSRFLIDIKIGGFKEYPLDKPYSVSTQPSIWQKEFLLEILKKGENIWQTEIDGSKRVYKSRKKVIWTDTPILTYVPGSYMKKGRIVKSAEQWCKENW